MSLSVNQICKCVTYILILITHAAKMRNFWKKLTVSNCILIREESIMRECTTITKWN